VSPPVLTDALGPRGRRRAAVASVVTVAALAGLIALALIRFADHGQLDADRWSAVLRWGGLRQLLEGLVITLEAAAVSMLLAILVGIVMAAGRLSRTRPVRWAAGVYVEFFRAIPILVLIVAGFLVLPTYGIELSPFWSLVLALTAYNGAVLGELFRAGVLSLERGQIEAARAVGLSDRQTAVAVIVPQAARRMAPAIVSQLVTLLKDTSLGIGIGMQELLNRGRQLGSGTGSLLQALILVAAMFIVVNFTLSQLARRLEVRQRRRYGAGRIQVTGGPEDLVLVDAEAEARLQ
jgi:glutamate transport system permease protein